MNQTTRQVQKLCYLSTPAHARSFVGRFIWIYTDKGQLELTDDCLRFLGKREGQLDIPLESIADLSIGHYSQWAKPIKLDYMAVTYRNGLSQRTLLFTPTLSWIMPTWKTNKIVAKWAHIVRENLGETTHAAGTYQYRSDQHNSMTLPRRSFFHYPSDLFRIFLVQRMWAVVARMKLDRPLF
jgi:hypothetical protein